MSSMSWSPEFIEAVGTARDRDALVAAIENFEDPNAAGDSIGNAFTYDVDVTALDRPRRGGLPERGVLRVTVDVEAGQWDGNGTVGRWSAGTATNCSSFRVSATDGLHDLHPVDCAVADILPPEQAPEQRTPEPEPAPTLTSPPPTDPDAIRLIDALDELRPHAAEEAVDHAVSGEFPGSPVEMDRSDDEIVVVVGEWEDCLVAVLPEDGAPFLFTGFDRILLTRGEMGCTPQLYLSPVTTH